MKKYLLFAVMLLSLFLMPGCGKPGENAAVVATTKPVYDFTSYLCRDSGITVELLVTENLSCLHDYTLQVRQMRAIEGAQVVVLSGAGLEDFLQDALTQSQCTIDASQGISLICPDHHHDHGDHGGHHHAQDPHIWLSIENARMMADNIYNGLCQQFPEKADIFAKNREQLMEEFDGLMQYGQQRLSTLSCRDMITFHDGFSYFAEEWDLHILHALEEESGSEASAGELKELIQLVQQHKLPAIFIEENGSCSASEIVAAETGVPIYTLNMGMSDKNYFDAMRQNIDAVWEAFQ